MGSGKPRLLATRSKLFIGVVHLPALPGSPRWGHNLEAVIDAAVKDARTYEAGGADALCVENFHDVPFTKGPVAPETLAAMTAAGRSIRAAVKVPIGFNVLRNDAHGGLALCASCGGSFIRVNVHTGAMVTDQGLIEGDAYRTLRIRASLCPEVLIFADVHVKHAVPLGNPRIETSARDAIERGLADALIISGEGTGLPTDVQDVQRVHRACPEVKILLGSGVSAENLHTYVDLADGFIVGTSLKREGKVSNPVDAGRVAALARALHGSRAPARQRGPANSQP